MNGDREMTDRFQALKEDPGEAPSEELYRRIAAAAAALRQETPVPRRSARNLPSLLRFFGEWNYALEFKCAALAMMALTGFFLGHAEWQVLGHESFFSAIITGDISWED